MKTINSCLETLVTNAASRFKYVPMALVLGSLFISTGCIRRNSPNTPTEEQLNKVTHVVKAQGETLYGIAAWYTGQGQNWKLLVDANPGLNPNKMKIGDMIHIPRKLVVRIDPMPSSAASSGNSKRGTSSKTGASSSSSATTRGATQSDDFDSQSDDLNAAATPSKTVAPSMDSDSVANGPANSAVSSVGSSVSSKALTDSDTGAADAGSVRDSVTDRVPDVEPTINSLSDVTPASSTPIIEKRTKSRDELLQELLKDY